MPIYILSGFLGSGKTTLLERMLSNWKKAGLRPAVIMNEIGEVNLDGLIIQEKVPMAEMLSGCICCTIRGDLSVEMSELIQREQPDLIVIEATGAANPMEMFDAVTEVSLYMKLDIKPMITVVDSPHLLALSRAQSGKTYRLMQEQIRCASKLIINKVDRISAAELEELQALLMKWNPYAYRVTTVKCEVNLTELLADGNEDNSLSAMEIAKEQDRSKEMPVVTDDHQHEREQSISSDNHVQGHVHHSHDHVTVYTHYFDNPINSVEFESFIKQLPREVYRGKGILTFSDTSSRYLFQYAYREADYMKITPQGQVPDVAVFIGEHFDKEALASTLKRLESVG